MIENSIELRITEMVTTKICHDISGVIGAINNGLELLELGSEDMNDKYIELISNSAFDARARVIFFRLAYGFYDKDSSIDFAKVTQIVSDYFKSSQITVDFDKSKIDIITYHEAKLILNLLLNAASLLIYGGNVSVKVKDISNIVVAAKAKQVFTDNHIKDILMSDFDLEKLDSKNIQAYMLKILMDQHSYKIDIAISQTELKFELTK